MVLHKLLDKYLSSYHTCTKSIKGFENDEVLKTLMQNFNICGSSYHQHQPFIVIFLYYPYSFVLIQHSYFCFGFQLQFYKENVVCFAKLFLENLCVLWMQVKL